MTAKKSNASRTSGTPPMPKLTVPRAKAEAQITSQIEQGQQLLAQRIDKPEELEAAKNAYYKWDDYNRQLLRSIFDSPEVSERYAFWGIGGGSYTFQVELREHFQDIKEKLRRLESIREQLSLYEEPAVTAKFTPETQPLSKTRTVFIVHGRDEATKEAVARFLGKLELDPVILHEKPNQGRTIIEKFEDYSSVAFAVVLLTPDDIGGEKVDGVVDFNKKIQMRARQNVVFELGYFIGKLGRRMVCALHSEEIELPSDFSGVVYVPLDKGGGWKMKLARELKAAGIDVDLNKAI